MAAAAAATEETRKAIVDNEDARADVHTRAYLRRPSRHPRRRKSCLESPHIVPAYDGPEPTPPSIGVGPVTLQSHVTSRKVLSDASVCRITWYVHMAGLAVTSFFRSVHSGPS